MAQEEKNLLLKVFNDGLLYGLLVDRLGVTKKLISINTDRLWNIELSNDDYTPSWYSLDINIIKPYLRDMEDMTDEEKKEYDTLGNHCISTSIGFVHLEAQELIDWLNKKHFNWRGLPEDGYIRVTKENNPY